MAMVVPCFQCGASRFTCRGEAARSAPKEESSGRDVPPKEESSGRDVPPPPTPPPPPGPSREGRPPPLTLPPPTNSGMSDKCTAQQRTCAADCASLTANAKDLPGQQRKQFEALCETQCETALDVMKKGGLCQTGGVAETTVSMTGGAGGYNGPSTSGRVRRVPPLRVSFVLVSGLSCGL